MSARREGESKVPEKVNEHVAWYRFNDQIEWYDRTSGTNQAWYKWIELAAKRDEA